MATLGHFWQFASAVSNEAKHFMNLSGCFMGDINFRYEDSRASTSNSWIFFYPNYHSLIWHEKPLWFVTRMLRKRL